MKQKRETAVMRFSLFFVLLSILFIAAMSHADETSFKAVESAFEESIQPLMRDYCATCHSTDQQAGELNLERFTSLSDVKLDPQVWQQVLDQVKLGEMPPQDSDPLSDDQKRVFLEWVQSALHQIALENAGDPGPVVLRRLSNHEYTYTIRDLTGIKTLDPAREFPVDGAAGEGFTNVGSALVMSPALLTKYLDAAKEVAQHAVLLPNGIRFSASTSPQDWTTEWLGQVRNFYARHTTHGQASTVQLQGVDLDTGTAQGRLPLADYLAAVQGLSRTENDNLSPKYLRLLQQALDSSEPSVLLEPLREKYREHQLSVADIEPWQQALWKFSLVGQVGRPNGPQAWQEAINPLVTQQEFRLPLSGAEQQHVFLVARSAGDGNEGDQVLWENARLVAKNRPDIAAAKISELIAHLQTQRAALIEHTVGCLAILAEDQAAAANNVTAHRVSSTGTNADPVALTRHDSSPDPKWVAAWRDYLGYGSATSVQLEPLLPTRIERTPNYDFIQGWTSGEDLSVLANSSDTQVRIPGQMLPGRVAVHPSPRRAVVVAWKCPSTGDFHISGQVQDAHSECGDGVAWSLEVRRGHRVEVLSEGYTQGSNLYRLGAFEQVRLDAGQVVALVISPRDQHTCDMTTIDLTVSDGTSTWDLAKDVSPNILQSNPNGPWHFLDQPATATQAVTLPEPMARWCESPSAERAAEVRDYLLDHFPLTHPLLAGAWREFALGDAPAPLSVQAPQILEFVIPEELAVDAEFVVTSRLASPTVGSVQLQVTTSAPTDSQTMLRPDLPIMIGEDNPSRQEFQRSFKEFRDLFPIMLCYWRIVPVDEVVTLWLFYREDEHLRRLILDNTQIAELERLWSELLFISQAPLKQVDAFEQLYQFATQDRADLVVEFEKMRNAIHQSATDFRTEQTAADSAQRQAVLEFARRAWRRPLTEAETESLLHMPPRLMLVRVLTSPAFLYRSETPGEQTRPVNAWELATRLSYFLWSSLPDETLVADAVSGQLQVPEVLVAHVRRMMQDERIRRLAMEFGCQYLHVRDVATLDEKSQRHFPEFYDLREAMQEEVTQFFVDLLQNNRSILNLMDADYTFLNQSLADFYGIPIEGSQWQRVDGLRQYGRGGALGFSAALAKHSGASRTSAILRGMWVSEVLLGDKVPNPPRDVPTLPEEAPEGLSERQLIELHSSDTRCAGCHKRIDPYGFALEGFDTIGRLRQADTKSITFDGAAIDGMAELRNYLLNQRHEDFLRQFNRKLLGYALGRSVQLSDQPLLDRLVATDNAEIGKIIEQIVLSPQFQQIRGQP